MLSNALKRGKSGGSRRELRKSNRASKFNTCSRYYPDIFRYRNLFQTPFLSSFFFIAAKKLKNMFLFGRDLH